jgi:hypothetical protein
MLVLFAAHPKEGSCETMRVARAAVERGRQSRTRQTPRKSPQCAVSQAATAPNSHR